MPVTIVNKQQTPTVQDLWSMCEVANPNNVELILHKNKLVGSYMDGTSPGKEMAINGEAVELFLKGELLDQSASFLQKKIAEFLSQFGGKASPKVSPTAKALGGTASKDKPIKKKKGPADKDKALGALSDLSVKPNSPELNEVKSLTDSDLPLYQMVKGSDEGSRYRVALVSSGGKVAVRVKMDGAKLSLSFRVVGSEAMQRALAMNFGVGNAGPEHVSLHVAADTADDARSAVGAFLFRLALPDAQIAPCVARLMEGTV